MSNLDNIKVLVIDDQDTNISAIIRGLEKQGLNLNNLYPNDSNRDYVNEFALFIKQSALDKNIMKIYQKIKEYILKEKIDILFLDLNLTGDEKEKETSGELLIELLVNSDESLLTHLPIAIVSQYSAKQVKNGLSKMTPIVHILKDDNGFTREKFIESCEEIELKENLPRIVENYRSIKDSEEYQLDIKYIKSKLNNLNYNDKLDNILTVLDDINGNNLSTNEKLKNIEIITKTITKTLPLLCDKNKITKVIDSLSSEEIKGILGEEFPESLGNSLYSKIKDITKKEKDDLLNDMMSEIKKEVKEHISNQANIKDNDDILEKTGKLSIYIWNKIASTASGNA